LVNEEDDGFGSYITAKLVTLMAPTLQILRIHGACVCHKTTISIPPLPLLKTLALEQRTQFNLATIYTKFPRLPALINLSVLAIHPSTLQGLSQVVKWAPGLRCLRLGLGCEFQELDHLYRKAPIEIIQALEPLKYQLNELFAMVQENEIIAVDGDGVEDEAGDEYFEGCKARLACRIKFIDQMTELKSLGISLHWLMCSYDIVIIDLHEEHYFQSPNIEVLQLQLSFRQLLDDHGKGMHRLVTGIVRRKHTHTPN